MNTAQLIMLALGGGLMVIGSFLLWRDSRKKNKIVNDRMDRLG